MSYFPKAARIASPDFGYPNQGALGREGYPIIAIVNHIAQGTESGLDSEFENPYGGASANYGVMRDGTVHCYVEDENAAWTEGINFSKGYSAYQSNLTIPWIKECWDKQISPNLRAIGIEHEGMTGVPLTEVQYQATMELQRYLITTHGIPVNRNHIVGHCDIDSITRKYCPGLAFPWERLLADLMNNSSQAVMVKFLGQPAQGETVFSVANGNQIGSYSELHIQCFAGGTLYCSPDDGWTIYHGLPKEMTDQQVVDYATDLWKRGGANFSPGTAFSDEWLKGLSALRG